MSAGTPTNTRPRSAHLGERERVRRQSAACARRRDRRTGDRPAPRSRSRPRSSPRSRGRACRSPLHRPRAEALADDGRRELQRPFDIGRAQQLEPDASQRSARGSGRRSKRQRCRTARHVESGVGAETGAVIGRLQSPAGTPPARVSATKMSRSDMRARSMVAPGNALAHSAGDAGRHARLDEAGGAALDREAEPRVGRCAGTAAPSARLDLDAAEAIEQRAHRLLERQRGRRRGSRRDRRGARRRPSRATSAARSTRRDRRGSRTPAVRSSRTTGSRPLNGSSRISRRGRGASASRHCDLDPRAARERLDARARIEAEALAQLGGERVVPGRVPRPAERLESRRSSGSTGCRWFSET